MLKKAKVVEKIFVEKDKYCREEKSCKERARFVENYRERQL